MSTKKIGINPVTVLGGYTGNLTLPSSKQPGNVGVKNLPGLSASPSPASGLKFGNTGSKLPSLGDGVSNGTIDGIPSLYAWAENRSQKSTGNAGNALLEEGESSLLPKGKANSDLMKEVQASGKLSSNNNSPSNNNTSSNATGPKDSKDSSGLETQNKDTGKELPPVQDVQDSSDGTVSAGSSDETITEETPKANEDTTSSAGAQPMGYEEYLEELRKGYEAQLEAARKQAEETRQRAVIDAQSSYMQNLAGYGANAEHLAAAGMQGGGYSDYLNAQAYAQKRSDIQQANAQAAYENRSAEAQYQDYINSLNGQLAQKALEDERLKEERLYQKELLEEQRAYNEKLTQDERDYNKGLLQDERDYNKELKNEERAYEENVRATEAQRQKEESQTQRRDSFFANLLEQVIDPSTTLTSEALDAFAREYGLSDQQTSSLKSLLSATQAASQAKTTKERSESLLASALSDIETNGAYLSDNYLESLRKIGLSDEDYEKAKGVFQNSRYRNYSDLLREANEMGSFFDTNAVEETYENGMLTEQQYNNLKAAWNKSLDLDGFFTTNQGKLAYDDAKNALSSASNGSWLSENQKMELQKSFTKAYAVDIGKEIKKRINETEGSTYGEIGNKVIDIDDVGLSQSQFGNFAGGKAQNDLYQAYIKDAKEGKIQAGQICTFNFGSVSGSNFGSYMYLGNGIFVNCSNFVGPGSYYCPQGFKRDPNRGTISRV